MNDAMYSNLAAALGGHGDLNAAFDAILDDAKRAGSERATASLSKLDPLVRDAPDETVGVVALLAGALIEIGADGDSYPMSVFDRLGSFLDLVPREAPAPAPSAGDEDDPGFELPESFYECERSAAALLSRSVERRRTLPHKAALLAKIHRYEERYGFLGKMLNVLDDEPLLILHPSTSRAWQARMGGIADNFQLHDLLRAALAGDGPDRIVGQRPNADAIAAASNGPLQSSLHSTSNWQLANWRAVQRDGQIAGSTRTEHWIWNEGMPAEIEAFEGRRLIAIGPSSIQRSWNTGRVFAGMAGWLRVEAMLPHEESARLLRAITQHGL